MNDLDECLRIEGYLELIARLERVYERVGDGEWQSRVKSVYASEAKFESFRKECGLKVFQNEASENCRLSKSVRRHEIPKKKKNSKKTKESWFNKLPLIVKHKIFCLLEHNDLISFAEAIPEYRRTIMRPAYWSCVKMDAIHFNYFEVELIFKYLGASLRKVTLECIENDEDIFWTGRIINNKFSNLFQYCPNLTHLNISRTSNVDHLFNAISTYLHNLEYLNYKYCVLSDDHLNSLKKCARLKSVQFSCGDASPNGIYEFLNRANDLKSLCLSHGSHLNDYMIQDILGKYSKTINCVVFEHQDMHTNVFKGLVNCVRLEILKMGYNNLLTNEIFVYLHELSCLKSLKLTSCLRIADSPIDSRLELKFLKLLSLKNLTLNDDFLTSLAKVCSHISELKLKKIFGISDISLNEFLKQTSKLTAFLLYELDPDVTCNFLKQISNEFLPKIDLISIRRCPGFSQSQEEVHRLALVHGIEIIIEMSQREYLYAM